MKRSIKVKFKVCVVICLGFYLVLHAFTVPKTTVINKEFSAAAKNEISPISKYDNSLIPNGATCSSVSSRAGFHQKVFAYTIYGDDSNYWKGMPEIIKQVQTIYSGWFVRIYTDKPKYELLTNLSQVYDNLHVCDINNLPPPTVSLKDYPSMMWRYHILGDPQVDVVNFRDSDSKILLRDRDAVQEWLLGANISIHIMRDHPYHHVTILGGLWGARMTPSNRGTWNSLRKKMFAKAYKSTRLRGLDQELLKKWVWPIFKNSSMSHDSYNCKAYPGSIPFPSQRVGWSFVGRPDFRRDSYKWAKLEKPCPRKCRPLNHKDWLYC